MSHRLLESISWTNRPKPVNFISNSGTTDSGLVCYCCKFLRVRNNIPKRTCADKQISFWRVVLGFKIFRQNFQSQSSFSNDMLLIVVVAPLLSLLLNSTKSLSLEWCSGVWWKPFLVVDPRRWFSSLILINRSRRSFSSFVLVVHSCRSLLSFILVVLLVGHFVFLLLALCFRHMANKNAASAVSS